MPAIYVRQRATYRAFEIVVLSAKVGAVVANQRGAVEALCAERAIICWMFGKPADTVRDPRLATRSNGREMSLHSSRRSLIESG